MASSEEHCMAVRAVAHLSTRRPVLTGLLSFTPSIICIAVVLIGQPFQMTSSVVSDYFLLNDVRTRAYDAREAARREFSMPFAGAFGLDTAQARPSREHSLIVLFRAPGWQTDQPESLFTLSRVAAMKRAEDAIVHDLDYETFCHHDAFTCRQGAQVRKCALPRSLLNEPQLYGVSSGGSGIVCKRRENATFPIVANLSVVANALYAMKGDSESAGGLISWKGSTPWLAYSQFVIGTPFGGFANDSDRRDVQTRLYDEWVMRIAHRVVEAATPDIEAYVLGTNLASTRFARATKADAKLCVGSIIIIFVLLVLHTRSLFLSMVAITQVAMSFLSAYVIYRYVFRISYFSVLHVFAIYLLLGIGADDVFVFTDTWEQAEVHQPNAPLYNRMAWTYTRAIRAMGITSLTTAASFIVMMIMPIMPLAASGLWAALLITVQFTLVCTVYPCALTIWQRHLRHQSHLPQTNTDINRSSSVLSGIWAHLTGRSRTGTREYRFLERWFNGPYLSWLERWRYALLVYAIIQIIISAGLASQLQLREELDSLFPRSHPEEVAQRQWREEFNPTTSADRLEVRMTWGIKDIKREKASYYDRRNSGTVIMDDNFNLRSAAAQQHLLVACKQIANDASLVDMSLTEERRGRCWIRDFTEWRQEQRGAAVVGYETNMQLMYDVTQFVVAPDVNNGEQKFLTYMLRQDVMTSNDLIRVVAAEARFVSRTRALAPRSEIMAAFATWSAKTESLNKEAPQSAGNATVTAGIPWVYQRMQDELIQSLQLGVCTMLAVTATILTLMTGSFVAALLATTALASIVSGLLAFVYIAGWRIGITESITAVISMGYAFDGVAHVTTAYAHSEEVGRVERTRAALTAMGFSILFGIISTASSSAVLMAAQVAALRKLGMLVMVTMSFTLIASMLLLPATLLVCGPIRKHRLLTCKRLSQMWHLYTRPIPVDKSFENCNRNEINISGESRTVAKMAQPKSGS